MSRNRMHAVLDRQRGLERPQLKELFGQRGQSWLQKVRLPACSDQPLLALDLGAMWLLTSKIKELDELIGASQSTEEKLLESLPHRPFSL